MSKGKARQPYEFGTKVSLVISHKQGFALSSQALDTPMYDGHTLKAALQKAQDITGVTIHQSFVDKGYKGHGVQDTQVYISGQRKGITKSLKKALKRRSAIEPHIGHMKAEGKLDRNYLKGMIGAKLNAILCAIGHNLRLILNHLKDIFTFIWQLIFHPHTTLARI
jgi:IS5 family transposase